MRHFAIGSIALLALTPAACGKSAAPSAATGAQPTPTSTTQAQAQAVKSAPVGTPVAQQPVEIVPPIAFENLMALLPDAPSGWTRGKPRGGENDGISTAEATYELGDSSIHVELLDTSFKPVYLAPLQFSLAPTYSERSAGRYSKAAPVGGSPGFERWDADARSAEVTMVVANRIVVSAKGRNVDSTTATRALVTAIDQKKLKDLK